MDIKNSIIREVEILDILGRRRVLKKINSLEGVRIFEHADGCRINLDKLSDEYLNMLLEYIHMLKMEDRKL